MWVVLNRKKLKTKKQTFYSSWKENTESQNFSSSDMCKSHNRLLHFALEAHSRWSHVISMCLWSHLHSFANTAHKMISSTPEANLTGLLKPNNSREYEDGLFRIQSKSHHHSAA